MGRTLVVGVPRSGTTWVARAVAIAASAKYVHEPDNPWVNPAARPIAAAYGRVPLLFAAEQAPEHRDLWSEAFTSAPNVVVKSVFACLSASWIDAAFQPRVVVVRRNPLNVVASWLSLGWGVTPGYTIESRLLEHVIEPLGLPDRPGTTAGAIAWWVAVRYAALEHARAEAGSRWLLIDHDDACIDTSARFRELVEAGGWSWDSPVKTFLAESNTPGQGYVIRRVTQAQPDNWRRTLSQRELSECIDALQRFTNPAWQHHLEAAVTESDARQHTRRKPTPSQPR